MLEDRLNPAITVDLNYTYDNGFFTNNPAAQAAMQRAVTSVSQYITDNLSAIVPSGVNTWTANVTNPFTLQTLSIPGLVIQQNQIELFVAGGNLAAGELGLAAGGAYSASGTQDWITTIQTRGKAGVSSGQAFSTWGGMIGFSSTANWNFSTNAPASNQYDFQTVATHELLHLFGFGLGNPSFTRYTSSGWFTGPNVISVAGNIAMVSDSADGGTGADHFASVGAAGGINSVMNSSLAPGVVKHMTNLEYAALEDIGWNQSIPGLNLTSSVVSTSTSTSTDQLVSSSSPPAPTTTPAAQSFAISTGAGSSGTVQAYNSSGQQVLGASTFVPSFTGGARVAVGDVNGDGYNDYIVGAGPGGSPMVQVYDGRSGALIEQFYAYPPNFTGGVYVAVGNVMGNGRMQIVTGAGAGGGPQVAVFDALTGTQLIGFFGINVPTFTGGVRVAVGDVNGDGYADIICGAGEGGGPLVSVWSGRTIALAGIPTQLFPDFFAYEANLTGGVYVAVGDLYGDGQMEIITGAGEGGGPRVSAFRVSDLMQGRFIRVVDFFTGSALSGTGVRVACFDLNHNGQDDIITGSGPGGDGIVRIYNGYTPGIAPLLTVSNPSWMATGVYVA